MARAKRVRESPARLWRPAQLDKYDGPLLLDTHIWLWFVDGDDQQMDKNALSLLNRSAASAGLLVSDISYWELALKASKGKLRLSIDAGVWLQRAERAPGIRFLPLDRQILLLSTRLPGAVHNDPADRMLIATAQINSVPLVTADGLIVDYAKSHPGTPVVDARVRP